MFAPKKSLILSPLLALLCFSAAASEFDGTWRIELPRPGNVVLRTFLVLDHDAYKLDGKVVINGAVDLPLREPRVHQGEASFSVSWNTAYRIRRNGDRLDVLLTYGGKRTEQAVAVRVPASEAQPPAPLPVSEQPDVPYNGLAARPPMGWNSWNHFADRVDDRIVREAADALVNSGLRDAGYVYINIDDCWEGGRDSSGNLVPNSKFPDMKALADYVHSRGLKLGIYSTPGPITCGGYEGSYGHEVQDAQTFARWGIDYLKYDWCSASRVYQESDRLAVFQKMGHALAQSGRPILYSLSPGVEGVWAWAPRTGANLWRTTDDIQDKWEVMSEIGFNQSHLAPFAGPGHWNDPDMLEVGNGGMSTTEYRTHFSLWCLLAAPLIAGNDLRSMSAETLEILSNREAIAVNQDLLGKPGQRWIARDGIEVWVKELQDGGRAVGIFNRNDEPRTATWAWADLGARAKPSFVRDLWAHADLQPDDIGYSAQLPGHGVALLRMR